MNTVQGAEANIPRSLVEYIKRAQREDEAAMRELLASEHAVVPGEHADDPSCGCGRDHSDESLGTHLVTLNVSTGLIKGCHFCGTKSNLSRCGGCKVVHYCSQEHQAVDRAAHKVSCNKIKKGRIYVEAQDISLRTHAGDKDTPPEAFKKDGEGCGHFWGYHGTRPYMRACYSLIEALLTVNTVQAVEDALAHCLEMLVLNRNDNQGIRGYIPPLYLRLGRDQACYDFVKWWVINWDDGFEWDDSRGVLKKQDRTEYGLDLSKGFGPLSHLVSLTLLRIRDLLFWLSGLSIEDLRAVTRKKAEEEEKRARNLAVDAYVAVHCANKLFWGVLLNPIDLLTMRPDSYTMGSFQQVPHTLQQCYNSWAETPDAFDAIREMREWEEVQQALKAKENVYYVTT